MQTAQLVRAGGYHACLATYKQLSWFISPEARGLIAVMVVDLAGGYGPERIVAVGFIPKRAPSLPHVEWGRAAKKSGWARSPRNGLGR